MEWYMPQDKLSVHVGINQRLWLIRQRDLVPTLIRLGKEHTRLFWRECGFSYVPRAGTLTRFGRITWDEVRGCWCYKGRIPVPMRFNDRAIYGIAVEGEPIAVKGAAED
ncbi:MAG: hypothetical protein RDU89_06975 [bacterium]|nr:hypothetical protein [bacterium]